MTGRDDMAAPAAWATTLENVLAQQSAVLSDLGEWADRQRLCIADGQVDELLMVLGHRQVLVERLLDTQSELSGLTDGLEDRLQTVEPEIRHRLRSRMRDVDDALQRVLEQDDRDRSELERQRSTANEQLRTMEATRQARSQYATSDVGVDARRFADERG